MEMKLLPSLKELKKEIEEGIAFYTERLDFYADTGDCDFKEMGPYWYKMRWIMVLALEQFKENYENSKKD